MKAHIAAIEYFLPERIVSTESLAAEFPGWSVEKIDEKTGITERHIAAPDECASDLAYRAACKLFDSGACRPAEVDFLLLCTQAPDYFLPATACVLQHRLGIPTRAGALDFNLGCSGFVYGLGMAKGLIETGQASNVLLLTAETYSKYLHVADRSSRTIFGDGAAATLVAAVDSEEPPIKAFVYGTDGAGSESLIVRAGAMRLPKSAQTAVETTDDSGNVRSEETLFMNGPDIFAFTLATVPRTVSSLLDACGLKMDDIDLFIFHQANKYMLDHLRKRIGIPKEKFWISISHCGNTVSSTIPIALRNAQEAGRLKRGDQIALVGFGVGLSWAATLIRW